MQPKQDIVNIIRYSYCSEAYHKFSSITFFPVITDGVLALAEAADCFWLLDIIGSYQINKRLDPSFQIWRLEVNQEDSSAVVRGFNDKTKLIVEQEIPFTDFPLEGVKLYLMGGVILLPGER